MENFVNYVISLKFLSFGPSIPQKSEVFKLYETNLYEYVEKYIVVCQYRYQKNRLDMSK